MQPIDLLTQEDKELIEQYIISYASIKPQSIEQVLAYWNKNKKKLLKAFSGKLRISIPIEIESSKESTSRRYYKLYRPLTIYSYLDMVWYRNDPTNHPFINQLGLWLKETCTEENYYFYEKIIDLTKYKNCFDGKTVCDYYFNSFDKELKIPRGTKFMRAVRKVLEYYHFPHMNLFEKWRDDISVISTDKKIKANLVFSIHPIDYMTMSDNRSGWSSCMSWVRNGGYSTGTIEMLNSNLAVVVYLESNEEKFVFNDFEIPNKTWRALMFVHKDILLVGKHYPYQSEVLAKTALKEMQRILYSTLGWKYQYQEQLYQDMKWSYNNNYVKYDLDRIAGHKIITYMNIMYPDIIEDHSTKYWCCRNYVEKNLYLNLSGKATCMCCGEPMDEDISNDINTSIKYCYSCYAECGCEECHKVEKDQLLFSIPVTNIWHSGYKRVCLDCILNYYLYNVKIGQFRHHNYLARDYDKAVYKIPTKEVLAKYEIRDAICA